MYVIASILDNVGYIYPEKSYVSKESARYEIYRLERKLYYPGCEPTWFCLLSKDVNRLETLKLTGIRKANYIRHNRVAI